jgi:hypothetical protein
VLERHGEIAGFPVFGLPVCAGLPAACARRPLGTAGPHQLLVPSAMRRVRRRPAAALRRRIVAIEG